MAAEITAAFPAGAEQVLLIRDNDGAYGRAFRPRLRAMGIRDHPIPPRSPWLNGCAERLIGSIRRECLDHIIVLNAAHLRRVLYAYAEYYNSDRTHLALDKDAPVQRRVDPRGHIVSRAILGGLHRRYFRIPEK